MIVSFANRETDRVWQREFSKKLPSDIQRTAYRKLMMLNAATELGDLKAPPANRLEKLSGSREGQHSIRINQQWRICFVWQNGNATQVEIVDYH